MYAPSRTNSPCAKLKMPIMLAMMPSPNTTRTTIAPKLRISNSAMNSVSISGVTPPRGSCSHLLPVARLLERVRRAINCHLVEMLADQHQADREPVNHAARQRHRGVMGDVERRGIRNHLQGASDVVFAARGRFRQFGRFHRRRRPKQEVVVFQCLG